MKWWWRDISDNHYYYQYCESDIETMMAKMKMAANENSNNVA